MFCRASCENTLKCATEKAHSSKNKSKAHLPEDSGAKPTKTWPRPTQKPPSRRRCGEVPTRVRVHLGCGRNPLAASQAHSSGGCAINVPKDGCMGAYQKYLTKPSYSRLYKKTPSSHFKSSYTWRRRARAPTFPLASS